VEFSGATLTDNDFSTLRERLKAFAQERDWEQFHSPKNLAMALIVEAAELLEHFQWLTTEQSEALPADKRQEVELEMADIFIYLMRLSERLDVDLLKAVEEKIQINEEKYPVDKVRGSAKKYTEY
jgi:dCTP diphosphatase